MRGSRFVPVGLGLAAAVTVAACGGPSPGSSSSGPTVGAAGVNLGTATVQIASTDQLVFTPDPVTVNVGDIIQWTVPGTTSHTVTFNAHQDLSDLSLLPGGTWEIKFTTPGTYPYTCTVHPGMNGTITVK